MLQIVYLYGMTVYSLINLINEPLLPLLMEWQCITSTAFSKSSETLSKTMTLLIDFLSYDCPTSLIRITYN